MGRSRKKSSRDHFEEDYWENLPAAKTGFSNIRLIEKFNPRTQAQQKAKQEVKENVLTFLKGEAGTGKSIVAVAQAVEDLKNGKVEKIILSRPMVEAGKPMGHLPGTADDKQKPYLFPLLDNLEIFLGKEQLDELMAEGIIKFEAINFMRGRTFHDAFVIIDEAQNADKKEMYLALTRIGENSKYVVTYDDKQLDIPAAKSCISDIEEFKGRNKIGFHEFTHHDIVRSEMCAMVVQVYNEIQERQNA
jgi:phosphate starvation-inducible PhoH-like protein